MSRAAQTQDADLASTSAPETFSASRMLPIADIHPSRTNPRGKLAKEALAQLAASIEKQGILMPILVRPVDEGPTRLEIVSGHRRYAAAKAVGVLVIPATVRTLTDVEALEIQMVENLQRSDLSPLEEADGYRRLMYTAKYDAARIAERVGRSVKYVYDRIKLLSLTKDAQALLIDERITAGHAILLARLSGKDQARAMKDGALFQRQSLLFANYGERLDGEGDSPLKAVSVREFSDWIDRSVRFDADAPDPMLFPETAEALKDAPKVVAITYSHGVNPDARAGRTYTARSWKRADGKEKSKTCEYSTMGFVAVGPHRGEAFAVCVDKDRCTTHWGALVRAKKKRAAAAPAKNAKAAAKPEPKRNAQLEKALGEAHQSARKSIEQTAVTALGGLSAGDFIRFMARVRWSDLRTYLQDAGHKVSGESGIRHWIESAPVAQVQRAIAAGELEYMDVEITRELKIDTNAVHKEFERRARESVKVQTPAPAKGKKAKRRSPAADASDDE